MNPPAPEAIGFIAQCATCPQRAVLDLQPVEEWTCPHCTSTTDPGFGDADVAQAESDWPIGQVIG